LAAHDWKSRGGLPKTSNDYCHPGKAGGLPSLFNSLTGAPDLADSNRGEICRTQPEGVAEDFITELATKAHDLDAVVRKSVEDVASVSATL